MSAAVLTPQPPFHVAKLSTTAPALRMPCWPLLSATQPVAELPAMPFIPLYRAKQPVSFPPSRPDPAQYSATHSFNSFFPAQIPSPQSLCRTVQRVTGFVPSFEDRLTASPERSKRQSENE